MTGFTFPRVAIFSLLALALSSGFIAAQQSSDTMPASNRCMGCHNNLKTVHGKDVSIGSAWSASMMANSARDPYWQFSVRRETLDHPSAAAAIQTECAACHIPLQRAVDKAANRDTAIFSSLPLDPHSAGADGVSCTVCHQALPQGLGTPDSYNGNLVFALPGQQPDTLFGPYPPTAPATNIHKAATHLTTQQSDHLRQAGLCGSCHTLYTTTLDSAGKPAGRLPEQMVYLEWLHSDYREKQTCQQCHMPAVSEPAPVAALGSPAHDDVRFHSFTGANFLLQEMLNTHRDELAVLATPADLKAASLETRTFLQSKSAKLTVRTPQVAAGKLTFAVTVENLTGHKLPTAFPSRRAWLHVTVADAAGHIVFESGKLNADGSIAGNLNDTDPTRFSPHYSTITAPDQVEIFEPILGDSQGHVTTALLTASQYLKDNRILPTGFDKQTASADIAVHGDAATDAAFIAGSVTTQYQVSSGSASGPFHITAELLYQPVGFRWARNLAPYKANETEHFVSYFDQAAAHSAEQLAHAEADAK